MRFWLFCIIAAAAPAFAEISILSQTPSLFAPGDVVQTRFTVANDDGAGEGSVWVDGEMLCRARRQNQTLVCDWLIPHGGHLPYQVRYRRSSNVVLVAAQTLYSASLKLIRIQPNQPQEGRAALFFSKLEIQDSPLRPAPTGFIAVLRNGVEICRSALPGLTRCQAAVNLPGSAQYQARFSGDSNYPALVSPVVTMYTQHKGITERFYRNPMPTSQDMTPAAQSTPLIAQWVPTLRTISPRAQQINNAGSRTIADFSAGSAYFPNFSSRAILGPLFESAHIDTDSPDPQQASNFTISTANGGNIPGQSANFLPTLETIVEEPVKASTDPQIMLYPSRVGFGLFEQPKLISANLDGSLHPGGFELLTQARNVVAFRAKQPGFLGSNQINDVFFWLADSPQLGLIRLPMPGKFEIDILGLRRNPTRVLFTTNAPLLAGDLNTTNDLYSLSAEANSGQLQRVLQDLPEGTQYALAPDGSVVSNFATTLNWHKNDGSLSSFTIGQAGPMRIDPLFNVHVVTSGRNSINLLSGVTTPAFAGASIDDQLLQGISVTANRDASFMLPLRSLNNSSPTLITPTGRITLPFALSVFSRPLLSADGAFVYFQSNQALVPADLDTKFDIYRWHRLTNQFDLISNLSSQTGLDTGAVLGYQEAEGYLAYNFRNETTHYLAKFNLRDQSTTLSVLPNDPACGFVVRSAHARFVPLRCRNQSLGLNDSYRVDLQSGAVQLVTPPTFEFGNVYGFSADGEGVLYRDRHSPALFWRTANTREILADAHYLAVLSPNSRFAMYSDASFYSDGGQFTTIVNGPITLVDLLTKQRQSIPDTGDSEFGFSQDSCTIVSTGSRFGGLTKRVNPFCKQASNITLIRTSPAQPKWGEEVRFDVLVDHKSAEPTRAPSGIVRVQVGSSHCDVSLAPQGSFGFGRCTLVMASEEDIEPNFFVPSRIALRYFGDENFGWSEKAASIEPSQKPLSLTMQLKSVDTDTWEANLQISGALSNLPIRGKLSLSATTGVVCTLSAEDLAQARACRFKLSNPIDDTLYANLILDRNYRASAIVTVPLAAELIFSSGFE